MAQRSIREIIRNEKMDTGTASQGIRSIIRTAPPKPPGEPLLQKAGRIGQSFLEGIKSAIPTTPEMESFWSWWQKDLPAPPALKGTAGEKVAGVAGTVAGAALPIIGSYGTGGAAAVSGLGKILPQAGRAARETARGIGAGAAYGTARGIGEGKAPAEIAKSAGVESLIFGGLGYGGAKAAPYVSKAVGKIRGKAPVKPSAPVAPTPLQLGPGTQFEAGVRTVAKPQKLKLETGEQRLDRIIEIIRPETERQTQQAINIRRAIDKYGAPPAESKRAMVEFLGEALPEIPKKSWQKLGVQELGSTVQSIAGGAESRGFANVAERAAKMQGFSLEKEFAITDLPAGQRLKAIAENNHWAMILGLKTPPKVSRWSPSISKSAEEPFVRQTTPAVLEGVAKDFSKQRILSPETTEWAEAIKNIRPTPQARTTVVQESKKLAQKVVEHARDTSTPPPVIASTYRQHGDAREFINRTFSSVEGWLGTKGEPGKKIVNLVRQSEHIADREVAQWTKTMVEKVAKLSSEERANMREVVRGAEKPVNDKVREAAKSVSDYYVSRPERIKGSGLTLRTAKGEDVPFELQKNHFPLRLDWKKIEDKTGKIKPDVLKRLVDSGQAKNIQEADRLLRTLRRVPHERHATFQHEAAKLRMPEYEIDPLKALRSDLQEAEVRIAQAKVFGRKDEQLLAQIESLNSRDQLFALKVADRIRGIDATADIERHLIEGLLSYNVISKLGLAAIPNATQLVNTSLKGGVKNLIRGIKSATANRKEAEEFAIKAGVLFDPASVARAIAEGEGGFGGAASKFLRATGFSMTEYWNRLVTLQAAKGWAEDGFQALKQPGSVSWVQRVAGKQPERIRRLFGEYGIDVKAALKRGSLTEDELAAIARRFMAETQFPAGATNVPLWASSPWGRVVFQFKRYAFNQARLLQKELLDESVRFFKTGGKDGSLRAWGPFLTMFPSAGWMVGAVRDWISGKETPGEKVERLGEAIADKDAIAFLLEMIDAYTWVGGLGIMSDTAQQLSWGEEQAVTSLLGPSAALAESVFSVLRPGAIAVQRAATGQDIEPEQLGAASLRSAVRGNVPFAGYQLGRGELPFGIESEPLKRIFKP